ncbi:MAG: hypothetical protein HY360_16070 [Verrucomicrobia bacterium]|nr:hypothetical protein [Verrucomicrobiota bacterium]
MKTTPLGLLLSGTLLIVTGLFVVIVNALLDMPSRWWDWGIVLAGAAGVASAFIWVNHLSDATKRKFMALSPTSRRLFWPFQKHLDFFPDDAMQKEVERLKRQTERSRQLQCPTQTDRQPSSHDPNGSD